VYTKFYGLEEKPFEITPDPKFLYLSDNYKEALAHLVYAVRERKGFTVVTGEVGTGKTTLVQTLLSRLDGEVRTAYVFNPKLGATDFLHYICEDLGLKGQAKSKGQCIAELHNFLMACYARNENVVLIIDEAHTLDPKLLEEVRLLTNLETPKSKLLQVILMGQPELDEVLNRPQFRQLKQRVSLRFHMQPLDQGGTERYIRKRLEMAGAVNADLFTPKAVGAIYRYSKGIPRLINILCDNALLAGYAADQRVIQKSVIQEVIGYLEGAGQKKPKRFMIWVLILVVLFIFGATFLLWKGYLSNAKWEMIEGIEATMKAAGRFLGELLEKILR